MDPAQHLVKASIDALAVGVLVGSLGGWLPPIATVLTIIVACMHIYDFIAKRLGNK